MKFLIINGAKYYPFAKGELNKTLFDKMIEILSCANEIKTTTVENGYKIEEEIEKFKWADVVIFQSPIFWYSVPGIFKTYFDEVYLYDKFYTSSLDYGRGGLLKGKKYMYSFTLTTKEENFGVLNNFFDGKSAEDFFLALHKIQQFVGLEPIKTYYCFNAIHNPDISVRLYELEKHIKKYILDI